jgi:hypothetical protein
MSDVYFVRPHYHYDPYVDLYRLIELSGYPLIYYEDIDPDSQNCYILTMLNGEINENGWGDNPRATIILNDIEWRLKESDYAWPDSDLVLPKGVSRVWTGDKWYAERIGGQYVPMGSHAGLVGTSTLTDGQSWDVSPLSYFSGRRTFIMDRLRERGVTIAPNAWGEERDAVLKASSAIVHIHQHERIHTVTPLRFAIAAAWHKPLISEKVYDRGIFDRAVLYADYGSLPDYTTLMVRRYSDLLQAKADELYDLLCIKNTFRSFVEAAL